MSGTKRFILWSTKDGGVARDQDGNINTAGILGELDEDNAYLTAYPQYLTIYSCRYPDGKVLTHRDLAVGEHTVARYSLSGSTGVYEIWRTK